MLHARDDHDDLLCLLEQGYGLFRDFLALRTGDATLAGELLRDALGTTLSANADSHLTLAEFSIPVLKAALRSLRHRDQAARARARQALIDLPAVLADHRALLQSTSVSPTIIEPVIDSFARARQRELVRLTLGDTALDDTALLDAPARRSVIARLLLRANRRLRIAMHQQDIANIASAEDARLFTIVNIARWPLRRRMEQIAIDSGRASFEMDPWFADWLHTPDAALNQLRPDECLRTRAGRERLTDEYLRHLIHREHDRQQMQRLFVAPTPDEPLRLADEAYFEELRRGVPRD